MASMRSDDGGLCLTLLKVKQLTCTGVHPHVDSAAEQKHIPV